MARRLRTLALSGLCALTVSAPLAGCYGSFSLTKRLYRWNGGLGSKFAESAVMWVLIIIPVYELSLLGDFVLFNLIEFWSGKNPVAGGPVPTEIERVAEGVYEIRQGDAQWRLTATGAEPGTFELHRDGRLAGRGRLTAAGDLELTRAVDGETVRLPRAALEAFHGPAGAAVVVAER
jgi:hypothetical protein